MNRTTKAFFITLALYALLLLALRLDLSKPSKLPPRSTLSLTNLRIIQPKPTPPKAIPPQPPKPKTSQPHKKPSHEKIEKIVKPTTKKATIPKHTKKKKRARIKKVRKKSLRKIAKRKIQKPHEHNTTLPSLSALFAKPQPKKRHKSALASLPPDLRKLYKSDFSTFSKEQKRFIKDNLARIAQITQKYLYLRGYPYVAIKTRQEGVNAVEFILHPNGDITDLRLITSSGYEALDQNSIETIKTAYKDYPRPKEPTKIRINVRYTIIY